jgi:hypothetical protein
VITKDEIEDVERHKPTLAPIVPVEDVVVDHLHNAVL